MPILLIENVDAIREILVNAKNNTFDKKASKIDNFIALKDVITQMNEISGYEINIKINPLFVRENEIIRLSGSTDKLYSLIGNMEQKEFKNTLKDMYND